MKIQEITEKFGNLKIFEKRCINDAYAEIVFAVKPSGLEPSKNHKKVADAFGGIFFNQTLFQKNYDDMMIVAMFWPWQNGKQVTLKIAATRKK
ncbi:MAG: hypothetical protein JRF45_04745 [Deltaproteobacteria bacterium]|nr:hypothetical protein [Deltaproteobacteria bacterium]